MNYRYRKFLVKGNRHPLLGVFHPLLVRAADPKVGSPMMGSKVWGHERAEACGGRRFVGRFLEESCFSFEGEFDPNSRKGVFWREDCLFGRSRLFGHGCLLAG